MVQSCFSSHHNKGNKITKNILLYCVSKGIEVKTYHSYSPPSNGMTERPMKEHWTRFGVLLRSTSHPLNVWDEAMNHANLLGNRRLRKLITTNIPILLWHPNPQISFKYLLRFAQKGYSVICRSTMSKDKKFLPRSNISHIV